MTCPDVATDLGAYVLGALEPGERRRIEEHLQRCPSCSAELAEFAGLPELLDRVDPADLTPAAVAPSPELFARMSAAACPARAHADPGVDAGRRGRDRRARRRRHGLGHGSPDQT